MKTEGSRPQTGQALPMVLILGTVLGIFALTMVFLLVQETKHGVKVNQRGGTFNSADAAIDRALAKMKEGDNWNLVPNIPMYDGTSIFRDVPGIEYRLWIHEGDLIKPPGDDYADRTVTVDATMLNTGAHKRVQAVISRQPFTYAVTSRGGLKIAGNSLVYWGDIYSFSKTDTMTVGNNQFTKARGDGYPQAFSVTDIAIQGGGGNFTTCMGDPYYHAYVNGIGNCMDMPDPPSIQWSDMRAKAKASGCPDWTGASFYTGVEQGLLFKPGDSDYPGAYVTNKTADWDSTIQPRLDRMASCSKFEDENMTVVIDTTDGNDPKTDPDRSNWPMDLVGTNNNADKYFNGQFITAGSFAMHGGGGRNKTITPPPGNWLPVSYTGDINFEGLVAIHGDFDWNGNPLIYGSILVDGSYLGSGTFYIYYNYYFPYDGISGGTFAITSWRELDPVPSFITPTPYP